MYYIQWTHLQMAITLSKFILENILSSPQCVQKSLATLWRYIYHLVHKDKRLGKKSTQKQNKTQQCGYSKDCHGTDKWVFCPIQISLITSVFIIEAPLFCSSFYNFVPTTKEIKAPKLNARQCNSDLTTLKQRVGTEETV